MTTDSSQAPNTSSPHRGKVPHTVCHPGDRLPHGLSEEGDVFRIFVPLKVDEKGEVNRYGLPERQQKILSEILANPRIQVEELMEKFDLSRSTILREIQEIKKRSGLVYDKKSQTWVQK